MEVKSADAGDSENSENSLIPREHLKRDLLSCSCQWGSCCYRNYNVFEHECIYIKLWFVAAWLSELLLQKDESLSDQSDENV